MRLLLTTWYVTLDTVWTNACEVLSVTLTVLVDGDALDVGLELAVHSAVGVADGTTSNSVLAADIAYLRHDSDLHRAAPVALGADNLQKPNYFITVRDACKYHPQVLVAVL